jgi:hypothetical protein
MLPSGCSSPVTEKLEPFKIVFVPTGGADRKKPTKREKERNDFLLRCDLLQFISLLWFKS